jgi:CHAT domain-containing protein
MQQFYRNRQGAGQTKAEGLRQAQLAMLRGAFQPQSVPARSDFTRGATREQATSAPAFVPDPTAPYAHPYYWAPFILMGNWL